LAKALADEALLLQLFSRGKGLILGGDLQRLLALGLPQSTLGSQGKRATERVSV
jgi:hypothetical protein